MAFKHRYELIFVRVSDASAPKPGSLRCMSNPGREEGCEGRLVDAF